MPLSHRRQANRPNHLPGRPVPVSIQCILRAYKLIIIIMRSCDPFTLQKFSKCRHTKSVPIMGLKFKKRAHKV